MMPYRVIRTWFESRESLDDQPADTNTQSTTTHKMADGGHSFGKKTFHKPTYCHHCSDLLWGLIGQGYICEGIVFINFIYLILDIFKSTEIIQRSKLVQGLAAFDSIRFVFIQNGKLYIRISLNLSHVRSSKKRDRSIFRSFWKTKLSNSRAKAFNHHFQIKS